jgi:N-acetylgalactosamine-6-sulfatase
MSVHKSPNVRTPNLDELFSQGTEFHQFHVNSPVCSPSRAALYTGQFPGRNEVFWIYENAEINRKYGLNDWLDPELVMLPRLMKNAGYVTGHYGKWHLGDPAHAPTLDKYGIDDGRCWNGPPPATWGHDAVYQQTIDFIRKHKDVPFFMNLWTREPHTPHWLHNETLELPWIKELPEDERVYAAPDRRRESTA